MEQQRNQLTRSQKTIPQEIVAAARVFFSQRPGVPKPQSVSILFLGAEGTGKTLALEVLAKDLGVDVYRVDLTEIVSKYIGETEKNLRRVFKTAESKGVILLLDEADALFGKRTDVKDAHDRFANIEINYLLQRIEKSKGIVILALKRKRNMDEAFCRRFRFVLNFDQ